VLGNRDPQGFTLQAKKIFSDAIDPGTELELEVTWTAAYKSVFTTENLIV